jgi:GT2 family glycosyltransferase
MSKIKEPLVSIIITNFNGMQFLDSCIRSILKQTHKNLEIILVDNNSSDESVKFVNKVFPNVMVIKNSKNYGFAGGDNRGYKKSKGEFVVILNNDTELQKNVIEELLLAFKKNPRLGAVQPMIRLMNDKKNLDACGSFWTNTGFNYHYGIYKNAALPIYQKPYPVYSLKGVCMMIPRSLIDKLGLFDDDFWCYFEETDFCHRVWLSGYECWYYPTSFLYHFLSGTRLKKSEAFIQYHSFKNRLCSYIKNLGLFEAVKVIPVYLVFATLSSFVYLLKGNIDCFISVYRAFWWNIKNIQSTLTKRRNIQLKIRALPDSAFFPKITKYPRPSYYFRLITGLGDYKD